LANSLAPLSGDFLPNLDSRSNQVLAAIREEPCLAPGAGHLRVRHGRCSPDHRKWSRHPTLTANLSRPESQTPDLNRIG
jgi:hypothetical protein